MERVINDQNGITWTCIQTFTGLSDQVQHPEAAHVKGEEDSYWVVCTPSGQAQSVRLKLPKDWDSSYSDQALLDGIKAHSESK